MFTANRTRRPKARWLSDRSGQNRRARRPQFEGLETRCLLAGDVVLEWNAIALEAHKIDHSGGVPAQGGPTRASRALAIVHASIYETVNAVDGSYAPYLFTTRAPHGVDVRAATAAAAHHSLVALYPRQQAQLDAALAAYLDDIDVGAAEQESLVFGRAVSSVILASRNDDGSAADPVYVPGTEPGDHLVDPLHPAQGFLSPGWGSVTPFAMDSGSQFRVEPPPALNSPEYAAAFQQVKLAGAMDAEVRDRDGNGSLDRTPEQTEIGIYWGYDGSRGLGTPPRLYNQIAQSIAVQQGNTLVENARLFALVNFAMADAGIASWETKYFYDFWRPVVAIREGESDGNPDTIAESDWVPLGAPASNSDQPGADFTPPFPAYTSGHATFGAALFRTLANFYGTDEIAFDFQSDEFNGVTKNSAGQVRPSVTRHFDRLSDATMENAISRIYLGIHWNFDAEQGIAQGTAVADHVFDELLRPLKVGPGGQVPEIESLLANSDPVMRGQELTLTAVGAADADGTIARVKFWEDDGDWILNSNNDTFLGLGGSLPDGWSLTVMINDQPLGRNVFFAQAQDNDLLSSAVASTAVTVASEFAWQNLDKPMDVTADGSIVPLDALRVFNELNQPTYHNAQNRLRMPLPEPMPGYFDVNRDDFVTPIDALIIINYLNAQSALPEGESVLADRPAEIEREYMPLFAPETSSFPIASDTSRRADRFARNRRH